MFYQRRALNADYIFKFQLVLFLIAESFPISSSTTPTTPVTVEISMDDKDIPSEFPKQSNEIKFQGPPILEMRNFENNTSFRDVINTINQIVNAKRQESILANQRTAHLDNASRDTRPNRTETASIHITQNIVIYQYPTETIKWFLLTVTVLIVGVLLAFRTRRNLLKNQNSKKECLIACDKFGESINVI